MGTKTQNVEVEEKQIFTQKTKRSRDKQRDEEDDDAKTMTEEEGRDEDEDEDKDQDGTAREESDNRRSSYDRTSQPNRECGLRVSLRLVKMVLLFLHHMLMAPK